ncbi:transposase-like protein [Corynebacterium diphtheriae str. Aberdeen]|nr:transposase-like protein [Corynebacterium diphtheriae str. Aberdeen]CAB0530689.1 IS256 family transposase [Corynebacterium diphtheriae]CAB0741420.1 IS256 family transposase [Corynebacterium diphtheriae]
MTSFKGLPEAGEATWLGSMVQTCVVHLIRAANRWVAYGDRKPVSAALKKVYTVFDEAGAAAALAEFASSELGEKYPRYVKVWCNAWEWFIPFCSFRRQPAMLSTSRIRLSRLTMSCVNLPATASNFTNDESALKALWLMICNIEDKRLAKRAKEGWRVAASAGRFVEGGKVSGWKQAINQMAVAYSDRFDQYL